MTRRIKERCLALQPELLPPDKRTGGTIDDLRVVREAVGLRPTREGGIRLEAELLRESPRRVVGGPFGQGQGAVVPDAKMLRTLAAAQFQGLRPDARSRWSTITDVSFLGSPSLIGPLPVKLTYRDCCGTDGGYGFQSSWASAEAAVELAGRSFDGSGMATDRVGKARL